MNSSTLMAMNNTTTSTTTSNTISNTTSIASWGFRGISVEAWLAIAGILIEILLAFWKEKIVLLVKEVLSWAAKKKLAVKRWWRSIRGKTPDQEGGVKDIENEAGAPLESSISMANSHTTQVVNNYYSFHHDHPAADLQLPAAALVRPASRITPNAEERALLRTRLGAATWSGVRDGNASPPDRVPFKFSTRIIVLCVDQRLLGAMNWRLWFATNWRMRFGSSGWYEDI
ncbi:uncharacterized protein H6S33_006657 [Morchella sextelata]|uniref:uncharacterized protein n=1 Tax=Morchella sextelata TaxID=1174677 RepID=UPI001D05305E|nr:uncharacterized protein H6S33_006657 [Morchella sextelata]KAH0604280.1 hypothetical protein H6S33_006657 [Morchella sextelata]